MSKVYIFSASSNNNLKLANAFATEAKKQSLEAKVLDLGTFNIPLYGPTTEKDGIPESINSLKKELVDVHAMVFVAPEYNGGLPPTITNLLAWLSVSGKDWRDCFNGKVAAIGTHSGSGGVRALEALRTQLSYIGLSVVGRPIHTHYEKPLNPESMTDVISQLKKLAN